MDATSAAISPLTSVVMSAAAKTSQLVGTPAVPVIASFVSGANPVAVRYNFEDTPVGT